MLFLIGFLSDKGGAERFALGLATHLPRDRFDVWFCCTRGAREGPVRTLEQHGIPWVDLGRRNRWDVHRLWGLVRLLKRERFDVLHAHMFGSNLWGTLIGRACRVPVLIAHEQTWAYRGNRLRAWLDGRVIGRLATRFVSVSPADAQRMISYEGVPSERIVVIPNAYIPRVSATPTDLRRELGISSTTPLIVTAAVFRPQKALDVLLEAHALVLADIPEAHLAIAGDGELRRELERKAADLGLGDKVHFLGVRQDVDAILQAADVAALSSDFEGTPLFMFECMANRTPLISTAVGGLSSVIDSGRSGLLVPPRDPRALAGGITALLNDPDRRQAMAQEALSQLGPFTIEAVTGRFAELYQDLVGSAQQ